MKDITAQQLAANVFAELLCRSGIKRNEVDEVVLGNVAQPSDAANIARVSSLMAGIPKQVPAMTVQRNCASGMEAISTASLKILQDPNKIIIAGGTESMSNIPLFIYRAV